MINFFFGSTIGFWNGGESEFRFLEIDSDSIEIFSLIPPAYKSRIWKFHGRTYEFSKFEKLPSL